MAFLQRIPSNDQRSVIWGKKVINCTGFFAHICMLSICSMHIDVIMRACVYVRVCMCTNHQNLFVEAYCLSDLSGLLELPMHSRHSEL